VIQTPQLLINLDRRTVQTRSAPSSQWLDIPLSPLEFDLLSKMASQPGRIWARDQLSELWEPGSYEDLRVVDSCIKRLRQKLGREPQRFIHTKTGIGYAFEDAEVTV
jgi:DNA-binding response OmpR family regulator